MLLRDPSAGGSGLVNRPAQTKPIWPGPMMAMRWRGLPPVLGVELRAGESFDGFLGMLSERGKRNKVNRLGDGPVEKGLVW